MKNTSWNNVADWYNNLLTNDNDSYQSKVIAPNLLRLIGPGDKKRILDLGCGQGFFSELLEKNNWSVNGIDLSADLIKKASSKSDRISYHIGSADNLSMFNNDSFETVVSVLALQNMANLQKIFNEVNRVLKKQGRFIFVINHPAFRIPQASSWGFDETLQKQYRRIDSYMSETKQKIDMTPGSTDKKTKKYTTSFHHPLQTFGKLLGKNNLYISRIEEWVSHKTSQRGPKQHAEDMARKEFPLFLCIESTKII
jgi:ubiquinone/menaquinone biosynthesis C-methylase UbiE